jgi:excisionase family DNA binding protein
MVKQARFLTIRQFMDRFQLSRSTVYRLIGAGMIVTVKIGRSVRIPEASAESWEHGLTAGNDNAG